jgi:ribosomal protein S18 acetylase RimI-like enzyme
MPSMPNPALAIRPFEERDLAPLVALLAEAFPDPEPHNEPVASIRRKLAVEARLRALGCVKLNLQVVASNALAVGFRRKLGFRVEERVSLGKRLLG